MKQNKSNDLAIDEFMSSVGLLVRKMRSASPSGLMDLSWTQKGVVTRLDTEGPTTIAELARAEGVKPQSMGAVISALEELGLVERRPHESDGRQFVISVTPKGKSLRKSGKDERRIWLTQAMAKLGKKDQEKLLELGEIIKRLVEQ
jgi:DNA-binding MarR family transcriptional regulator